MIKRITGRCLTILLLATMLQPSRAEAPIVLVGAYTAGGPTDLIARVIAARLSAKLGSPVIVENRSGATGQIGSRYVAKSAPDGHTLQIATQTTHAVAPSLYKDLGYDPIKDFTPIALVAWSPLVLISNVKFPVSSVKDLIAHIKSHPGEINYATGGRGDGSMLAALFFNKMAQLSAVAVPFQGEAPALPAVLGGHLPYMFVSAPTAASGMATGQIRALAVTSKIRAANLPEVPTMEEAGLPGYEMVNWWGIFGPAGMARDTVMKINQALVEILQEPQTRQKLQSLGYELTGSTPEACEAYVKSEKDKWAQVIVSQGLKPQ